MPSESKAACCIAPDSEWATGWPMRTTRFVMLAPFRGRRRSRGRRSPPTRVGARWSRPRRPGRRSRTSSPGGDRRGCRSRRRGGGVPSMSRSSPSTSMTARRGRSARPRSPAIRSDSLWRSSPAPRIVVVPPASAAARHRTGISSIAAATSAGPRSMPWRSDERTSRSATGSPTPSSTPDRPSTGRSSIWAPMRRRRSMMARRVGFTPTPSSVSSASGWIAPATSQKAAADTSPGTRSSTACTDRLPAPTRPRGPVVGLPRSTGTPLARSIRSVWSRVAMASRTVVVAARRARPASRIADLTWALGTGVA